MGLTEWAIYGGIVAIALVVGVIGGLVLACQARRGLRVPEWAKVSPSRRLGAVVLSLLAILTVLSSMLTSYELQRVEAQRVAESKAARECTASILDRIAERTRISDSYHHNTTEFVRELKFAAGADDLASTSIIRAADRYLNEQKRLDDERRSTPIREHECR